MALAFAVTSDLSCRVFELVKFIYCQNSLIHYGF